MRFIIVLLASCLVSNVVVAADAYSAQPAQVTYSFRVTEAVESDDGIQRTIVAQGTVVTSMGHVASVRIPGTSGYPVCVSQQAAGPCENELAQGRTVILDLVPWKDTAGDVLTHATLRLIDVNSERVTTAFTASKYMSSNKGVDAGFRLVSPPGRDGKQFLIEVRSNLLAV